MGKNVVILGLSANLKKLSRIWEEKIPDMERDSQVLWDEDDGYQD